MCYFVILTHFVSFFISSGLSKREYNRFKGRLDKETRERFEKYGSFESLAGVDGVIDLAEFSDLMEQILLDMEEATMRKHTGV